MATIDRRRSLQWLGSGPLMVATVLGASGPPAVAQDAPRAIRIGWAISKTGSNAAGVAAQIAPNYQMWVQEVNAAGGIPLRAFGNRKVPIEVVEYDDRSSSEESVRAVERLITQDKVDFVLPPWGTGNNLAVGPTLNRHGYPHLAVTSITDRAPELVKRWPNAFFFLGTGSMYGEAVMAALAQVRQAGKIGSTVAMVSVADGFGVDLAGATRKVVEKHGFKLVYDKSYPVGSQDMSPILNEVKALNPDVFLAYSYPPDTFVLTEQSRVLGFNPKVFYTGIGTTLPAFKGKFGAAVDGVMSAGGVQFDSPAMQDYFRRHKAVAGYEPDRFSGAVVYASLQVLQQAIERVGKVDRAAVVQDIKSSTFSTVVGRVKMNNQMFTDLWLVGQWQDGEFYGVAPSGKPGGRPLVVPKPAWK